MEKQNYNLKLTIRAICMYEKLSNDSFLVFNFTPDNIIKLAYCILVSHPENKIHNTFEEMLPLLSNDSILEPIAVAIKKEIDFSKQFESEVKEEDINKLKENVSGKDSKKNKPILVRDIVPMLTTECNLDIRYIMDEMDFQDIFPFIDYKEKAQQARMEEERFFTFWGGILSQMDPKKLRNLTPSK